jgi:hypothetical protein
MTVPKEWLEALNLEFRNAHMEHGKRPWQALSRYSKEFNASFTMSSPIAKEIFEWFDAQSKPGAQQIGSLFESVYYFDGEFWRVSIPIVYGRASVNLQNCLSDMPQALKDDLFATPNAAWDYSVFWADCADYGFGIDDLRKGALAPHGAPLDSFGLQLLTAGHQELKSAVAQLKQRKPDPRAILNSRMALEIFLKAFIALKVGLTEKQAKDFGHDLEKLFDRFIDVSGYKHLQPLKQKLNVYPPIHSRYSEQTVSSASLWEGFSFAQSIGTIAIREHTDRNMLDQVLRSRGGSGP